MRNDYTLLDDRVVASTALATSPEAVAFFSDLQAAVYQDQPADTASAQSTADQGVAIGTGAQASAEVAQGTADTALIRADDANDAAATAHARADEAYTLAQGKVAKDAGPTFPAPIAAPTRVALPAYAGGAAAVAYDAAEIGALKAQVAALTAQLAAAVVDLRANRALTP